MQVCGHTMEGLQWLNFSKIVPTKLSWKPAWFWSSCFQRGPKSGLPCTPTLSPTVNWGRDLWSINFFISNLIRQNPFLFLTNSLCNPKHWLPHAHLCLSFPSERPGPETAPFHVGRVSYILCRAQCKMKFWAFCSKSRKKVKKCHERYWNIKLFFYSLSWLVVNF